MSEMTQVQCPICQARVPELEINSHLDMHLKALPAGSIQEHTTHEDAKRPQVAQSAGSNKRQRMSLISLVGEDGELTSPSGSCSSPGVCVPGNRDAGVTVTIDEPACQVFPQPAESQPSCAQTPADGETPLSGCSGGMAVNGMPEITGDGGARVLPEAPAAGSSDLCLSLRPEEHLRAFLLGSRTHALRCARDDSERMHAKALQLCGDVQQTIEQRRQDLEEYPAMAKPTDRHQQLTRNIMRSDLEDVARTVRSDLTSLVHASVEPEEAICAAEAALLEKFDSVMSMVGKLRAETIEEFEKCKEEEARKRESSEAAALALEPSLDCLDCFVRHLAKEVDDETTKATHVHTERLQELQQEQARFVKANELPERNSIFAKVIEDLASTKRALEEHSLQSAAYKDQLKEWEEVLEKMPKNSQEVAIPGKRSLLDGFYGFFGRE